MPLSSRRVRSTARPVSRPSSSCGGTAVSSNWRSCGGRRSCSVRERRARNGSRRGSSSSEGARCRSRPQGGERRLLRGHRLRGGARGSRRRGHLRPLPPPARHAAEGPRGGSRLAEGHRSDRGLPDADLRRPQGRAARRRRGDHPGADPARRPRPRAGRGWRARSSGGSSGRRRRSTCGSWAVRSTGATTPRCGREPLAAVGEPRPADEARPAHRRHPARGRPGDGPPRHRPHAGDARGGAHQAGPGHRRRPGDVLGPTLARGRPGDPAAVRQPHDEPGPRPLGGRAGPRGDGRDAQRPRSGRPAPGRPAGPAARWRRRRPATTTASWQRARTRGTESSSRSRRRAHASARS